jgi:hypothetical protein
MRRLLCWIGLVMSALAMAPGCSNEDPLTRYFPAQQGTRWIYRLQRTTMDGTRVRPYYVEHRGTIALDVDGALYEEQRTFDGNRYFYRLDPDLGWLRLAVQSATEDTPRFLPEPWLVMPTRLEAGHQWRQVTPVRVLEKTGPPQETLFRVQASLPVDYRVAAIDDTLTVPAGRFSRCLRIEGAGRISTHLGNYLGLSNVEVRLTEWYAPGVGLIKQVLEERTNKQALDRGHLVLELDAMVQP